jgi:hypothetical protein
VDDVVDRQVRLRGVAPLCGDLDPVVLRHQRVREVHSHIAAVGISKAKVMCAGILAGQRGGRSKLDDAFAASERIELWEA